MCVPNANSLTLSSPSWLTGSFFSVLAGFAEAISGVVSFPEIRAEVLEKVAEYLMYKQRYSGSKEEIPDFQSRVKPEIALEL